MQCFTNFYLIVLLLLTIINSFSVTESLYFLLFATISTSNRPIIDALIGKSTVVPPLATALKQ